MQWQTNPYFVPMMISGLIGLVNVFFIFERRKVTGAMSLFWLALSVSEWALAYALELASGALAWQVFWAKVEYIGIVSVSVLFFLFALDYAQYTKFLQSRFILLLWILPVVFLITVWTNKGHGLIWSYVGQQDFGSYRILKVEHGIVFWLLIGFSYIALFAGSVILFRKALVSPAEFKFQSFVILFGAVVTWAGNVIYISPFNPLPSLDWTPLSITLSGIIYSMGMFRFKILDLVPIAGETILESLDDVVIVLDETGRIAYINRAFEFYTGIDAGRLIGQFAFDAFLQWPELARLADSQATVRGDVRLNVEGHDVFYFDARVSTVRWKKRRLGRVIILDDISERKRAERNAYLFSQGETGPASTEVLPVIFVIHLSDEKIIEVNRSFILSMGYERKEVVGRSLLQLDIWNAYQRVEFLKNLGMDGLVRNHSLLLRHRDGKCRSLVVSADRVDVQSESYLVMIAQPIDH